MRNICLIVLISIVLGGVSCSEDDPANETVYTVAFDADGGSPVPTVQNVKSGEIATKPCQSGLCISFLEFGQCYNCL
jgi:hypothetical protein